ncbi:hypothetical protein MLD38_004172 [Melastoma candidum]|uniref:Uncharacterized protein n=1 Tax=Melastoma candidum TaxID=119954 RepID=A0ACB9S433_9MYRT|nr:hypothetical protein MLD38_004172 [Melastoma candidum]
MGNAPSWPCVNLKHYYRRNPNVSNAKLIFWEGTTRLLPGKHVAGEIMFEHPDLLVYRADSFYIGRPVPSLDINEPLLRGRTYLALPVDCFGTCAVLSASSIASLGSGSPRRSPPMKFGEGSSGPFEYVNGDDGRASIRVLPEFIVRLVCQGKGVECGLDEGVAGRRGTNPGSVCSTPELQKCYEDLVGSRDHVWSPRLETISEHNNSNNKARRSPCRFISFELKHRDNGVL